MPNQRLFVLDTNVLIHDPTSLFSFDEHALFLPMVVLEELDDHKKGFTDTARNARESLRIISELINNKTVETLANGIDLPNAGKLYLQLPKTAKLLSFKKDETKADNHILATCIELKTDARFGNYQTTLVTKDINLRVKAAAFGCHAEDYLSDATVEDDQILDAGIKEIELSGDLTSWVEGSNTYYRIMQEEDDPLHINQCLQSGQFSVIVDRIEGNSLVLKFPISYTSKQHSVWGMNARNDEQNFALNFLMNPNIDLVSLLGPAGTGKTLLALASALEQTIEKRKYDEIIVTRATIPLGEDIGFLPGTEEEKMMPWMGAIQDNIEALLKQDQDTPKWQKENTVDMIMSKIKIKSMSFMRGRTFQNKFIIIDEAQNLTPKQMKALITRVGVGTKIVCIGNLAQIDTPYLSAQTSGLSFLVRELKGWDHAAHVVLKKGERSRLASHVQSLGW